ncbi:hypothetical protein AEAC466_12470 [Asticcacaulis sp. AC466]|uniref:hypothetical protein n=1 Tax=Asticcacaulis sp. AC466 TaxID=1282362 RepID=UPI0003C3F2D2|nr:hypothetical protein [Asticcacaulis sp. AC466]ESQ83483.1 hypothetical protein AEAC466_12470 [Asticcacaulis sp. AC466]
MPRLNSYSAAYIADARAKIELQLATYHAFLIAAQTGEDTAAMGAARDAFEPVFLRNLILAMDHYFDAISPEAYTEGPINEVRTLCECIMHNHHKLQSDGHIALSPTTSVLGLKDGDDIRLTVADFKRLADAFFAEISTLFCAG